MPALLGIQVMPGVTVLLAGRSVSVKQVVAELEQMVDEKVHQGDMLVLLKDANAMHMMPSVVTVAVLRRAPIQVPVCPHSFGIPTHFILERFPNPSPSISSAQVLGITTPLRNCSPFVLCGIHLIQTSSRAHRLALGGFILSELRNISQIPPPSVIQPSFGRSPAQSSPSAGYTPRRATAQRPQGPADCARTGSDQFGRGKR